MAYTCGICGKEFQTPLQLRGHHIQCSRKEKAAIPFPQTEGGVKPDYTCYKELPPPIVEHLEKTFGNWLNYFEIGQVYKSDFGGYGMYIRVPQIFSTEYKTTQAIEYDNYRRVAKVDSKGNMIMKKVVIKDERWCSLVDLERAKAWIDKVKNHIITNAYRAGIRLPNTNTGYDETKQTKEDYEKAISGNPPVAATL